jgi:predicted N-formylglutamate amidohydrolase
LFAGQESLLESHAGYDAGALSLAKALGRAFHAPLMACEISRLLVDLNRSPGHPKLFSKVSKELSPQERQAILKKYYLPHRQAVAALIAANRAKGAVTLHVAVHSFTPVLDGVERHADVGLLYAPNRAGEKDLCARWKLALRGLAPSLAVRLNYPYRGVSDGLTTCLRREHPAGAYLGLELEMNQKFLVDKAAWARLSALVIQGLDQAITGLKGSPAFSKM